MGSEAEKYEEVYGLFSRERRMYEEILPQLKTFQAENDPEQRMCFKRIVGQSALPVAVSD